MADDIIERLRTSRDWSDAIPTMEEAADEITRLRAENEKLREALKTVCLGVVSERESLDWFIMDGAALRVARDAIRESGDE